jgi:hypothetical protein
LTDESEVLAQAKRARMTCTTVGAAKNVADIAGVTAAIPRKTLFGIR